MIGWFIKVSKPKGKDGIGERWSEGGVCPTMNVFENQTSTRAVVAVVHCYENHATDARVKEVQTAPTGGGTQNGCYANHNPLILCKFTQ